jgi:hypothetical protein
MAWPDIYAEMARIALVSPLVRFCGQPPFPKPLVPKRISGDG